MLNCSHHYCPSCGRHIDYGSRNVEDSHRPDCPRLAEAIHDRDLWRKLMSKRHARNEGAVPEGDAP